MRGWRSLLPILVFTALYAAVSLSVTNSYYQLVMTLVPVWAIFGLSWNLLSGYTGLISFGHAAFFGVGAYAVALGQIHFDLSPWVTIPIAAVLGGIAGLLIGFPTFRLQGHYFALAMLAYPLAILYVFEWLGLQEVTLPIKRDNPIAYMQFADHRLYTLLALAMMLATILLTRADRTVALRHGAACDQAERSRRGSRRDQHAGLEAPCRHAERRHRRRGWRILRRRAAGGDPAIRVRHAGVGTGADGRHVRRCRNGLGSGDRIGDPDPIGRNAQCRSGLALSRHSGGDLRPRDHMRHPARAGGPVLESPRLPAQAVGAAGCGNAERAGCPGRGRRPAAPAPARPKRSVGTGDVVLEVRNLSRSFGGLKAVQDVSFKLRQNEILGIIGPNGAGKTTLFNLLNGFLRPGTGEILLDGREMSGRKPHELCEAGIGRTFQIMRPFLRMSISDNVVVGAYVRARTDAEARQLAADAIARVGLSEIADRIAGELTTKELRLMELARALAGQPRILLLDETLAGLGHDEADEVVAVIQRLARDGMTIAIIEHTMQAMVRLVDSFLVLDHGAVIVEGEPEAVTRDSRVIEAYLGKKWMAHAPH